MNIFALSLALLVAGSQKMPGLEHSALSVVVSPEHPFREVRSEQQIVNFDLIVTNHQKVAYRIAAIRLEVFDRNGRLELRREVNENGKPAALDTIGDRVLSPAKVLDIFQPFYSFGPEVDLARMRFQLLLIRDQQTAPPVTLSADETLEVDVQPRSLPAAGILSAPARPDIGP